MKSLYILLMVVLVEIQAKELQPTPKNVTAEKSTQPKTVKNYKRQATKEVILYLTPSQIKAIQSGDAEISSFLPEPHFTVQDEQFKSKENYGFIDDQFKNIKSDRDVIPVYEHQEDVVTTKQEQQQTEPENFLQQFDYDVPLNQQAILEKLQLQGLDQWNQEESNVQKDAWVAYDSDLEKTYDEKFKEKWNKILELNRKQIKALSELEKSEASIQTEKPLLQLQYGTKYNDQKHAINIEKLIRERHQDELNKQSALVQAEAIASSPPILIREEVKITKHHPVPVFRPINLPVSAPVTVPISKVVKNIPSYRVPLQIKHILLPTGQIGNAKQILAVTLTKQKTSIKEDSSIPEPKTVPYTFGVTNQKLAGGLPIYRTEKVTILRPA